MTEMAARRSGICAACRGMIRPGQSIRWYADTRKAEHAACESARDARDGADQQAERDYSDWHHNAGYDR